MSETMKVRINGEVVDRAIGSTTLAIRADGSNVEYHEPKLGPDEVVFRPDDDPMPIIVTRTIPA